MDSGLCVHRARSVWSYIGDFVSAQLMNCRGRGGTDFYRFLCLRLVRSGTVADRATPRAPAPEGRLYEAAFTSSNRR